VRHLDGGSDVRLLRVDDDAGRPLLGALVLRSRYRLARCPSWPPGSTRTP
jgi:hypothetical protein